MMRTDFHFFNDARGGKLSSSGWAFPFACLTASTWPELPFVDMPPARTARVRWCYSSTHANSGFRLVNFDNGPANIQVMATQMGQSSGSPTNQVDDVTDAFNALVGGPNKNLGYQYSVYGGSNLIVYRASMEILWG